MLNIIVLGSGLIPRGYGIAPRKSPFPADLKLIKLLIDTSGLKPCFINPDTNSAVPLTAANCEKMYQLYGTLKKAVKPAVVKPVTSAVSTASSAPTSAVNTASVQPTTPVKSEETKTETTKVEEKKDEHIVINVNNNKDEKKK